MSGHHLGEDIERSLDQDCTICGHDFNPHVLIATMNTPELGGLVFCQELGCRCESTWSYEGELMPYIPDDETIEYLRALAQTDEDEYADGEASEN